MAIGERIDYSDAAKEQQIETHISTVPQISQVLMRLEEELPKGGISTLLEFSRCWATPYTAWEQVRKERAFEVTAPILVDGRAKPTGFEGYLVGTPLEGRPDETARKLALIGKELLDAAVRDQPHQKPQRDRIIGFLNGDPLPHDTSVVLDMLDFFNTARRLVKEKTRDICINWDRRERFREKTYQLVQSAAKNAPEGKLYACAWDPAQGIFSHSYSLVSSGERMGGGGYTVEGYEKEWYGFMTKIGLAAHPLLRLIEMNIPLQGLLRPREFYPPRGTEARRRWGQLVLGSVYKNLERQLSENK